MSDWVVAVLFSLGVAAWVYPKADRRLAHNTQSTLIVCAVVFIAAFLVFYSVIKMLFS